MHWTRALLVSALATGQTTASLLTSRSAKPIGRFTLPLQRRSVERRASGDEAVATIYGGTDWVTSCNLGGQDLRVQIDTGSADLWVVSTLLPNDFISNNLSQNRIYDPSKSTSWKAIQGAQFNISYDVGELGASGPIGTETVNIGGATVTEMIVGAATTLFGAGIIDKTYDGTLGLGWQTQNTEETTDGQREPGPTFMEAIQSQLDKPVFTADFNAKHSESLSFGFINDTLYTGSLIKLPVDNSSSFWSIDSVTFSSDGKQLGGTEGINVLMDTGGVGTTTDQQTASDYWGQVKGSGTNNDGSVWLFPCDTPTLPDITLNFPSGGSATIKGAMLNQSAQNLGDNTCKGGVQATSNQHANAGFGFFASYFTVWDQSEPSISFGSYSDVDDTAAENQGDLPTASASAGATSTSSKAFAAPTKAPGLGMGVGIGALAAGLMAAL